MKMRKNSKKKLKERKNEGSCKKEKKRCKLKENETTLQAGRDENKNVAN